MNNVENIIRDLLIALGQDVEREGLKETPARIARMYEELLQGDQLTNKEIGQKFHKVFEQSNCDDLVVCKDITFYSLCEHHIIPFFGKVAIGYLPKGKVLGLSKMARITKMCSQRLQLQEKLGQDIMEAVKEATGAEDVIVVIYDTKHLCVSMRGAQCDAFQTTTAALSGEFKNDAELRKEFYSNLKV